MQKKNSLLTNKIISKEYIYFLLSNKNHSETQWHMEYHNMKLNINYRMPDSLREDIEITKFYKNILKF